jgi:hypothetical protein
LKTGSEKIPVLVEKCPVVGLVTYIKELEEFLVVAPGIIYTLKALMYIFMDTETRQIPEIVFDFRDNKWVPGFIETRMAEFKNICTRFLLVVYRLYGWFR